MDLTFLCIPPPFASSPWTLSLHHYPFFSLSYSYSFFKAFFSFLPFRSVFGSLRTLSFSILPLLHMSLLHIPLLRILTLTSYFSLFCPCSSQATFRFDLSLSLHYLHVKFTFPPSCLYPLLYSTFYDYTIRLSTAYRSSLPRSFSSLASRRDLWSSPRPQFHS